MGKRAQRRQRRSFAERVVQRRRRSSVVMLDREQFESERAAYFEGLRLGRFRRPSSPDSGEGDRG